jgi:hypothetical protein
VEADAAHTLVALLRGVMHEPQRDEVLHPDPTAQRVLQAVLVPAIFGEKSSRTVFAVGLLFDRADP